MINFFYNLAIWLSGADRNVLKLCSQGEHKRLANLGALILIPSLTGLISMSYAVSTFNSNPEIFISLGILWAFMVLIIDRYIVSTFKKEDKYEKEVKSAKFIVRLIFAIGVGITVSHPLVLLIFSDTILQERAKEIKKDFDKLRLEAVTEKEQANKYVKARTLYRDSLAKILQVEQSGGVLFDANGVQITSGHYGHNSLAISLEARIKQVDNELKDYSITSQKDVSEIDNNKHSDSLRYNLAMSNDYITKVNTLAILENRQGNEHIKWVKTFLLIFFIFLDIIPIALKVFTEAKEYDIKLRGLEDKAVEVFSLQIDKDKEFENNLTTKLFDIRNGKLNEVINKFDTFLVDDFLNNLKEEFQSSKYYKQNETENHVSEEEKDAKSKNDKKENKNSENKSWLDQYWSLLSDYKKELIEAVLLGVGGAFFAIFTGKATIISFGTFIVYVIYFLINKITQRFGTKFTEFFGDK